MKNYKYDGNRRFSVKSFNCSDTGEFEKRHEAIGEFVENLEKINEYQQKMFAEKKEGIIFVFQAMDAAGKDGAVRAVLSCLSPQGVSEHSFKVPSAVENRHDYLWRFWSAIPEKGSISIFNRSYYEDVLVQKVHKIYENNLYADRIDKDTIIDKRYEQIRNFEKYLWENSIRVVKIFLNVSKEEQAKRFISRIDTPKKNWKFSSNDIDERAYWDDYMQAYETCINRTARENSPWYVVPADHKWYARLIISRIVLNELEKMDPKWPVLSDEEMHKLQEYRAILTSEYEPSLEENSDDESGKKLKPSDIAVGNALKSDRKVLTEKKFRKLLKNSILENFKDSFGLDSETIKRLGNFYLKLEEAEAKAKESDMDAVKILLKEKYDLLSDGLMGCGKEGRKLLSHFKKASKEYISSLSDVSNISYAQYEEELKQLMREYEKAVSSGEFTCEEAMEFYRGKVEEAFAAHRNANTVCRNTVEEKIIATAAEYSKIAEAFHKDKAEEDPEEESDNGLTELSDSDKEDEATKAPETVFTEDDTLSDTSDEDNNDAFDAIETDDTTETAAEDNTDAVETMNE